MAEIKDSQLIRDALGSPVPQYWDETSQMYVARTVDGSFADVDFGKVRLLRDKLGSPIPQLWDTTTARFVPGNGGGNGDVTIDSVPGLRTELDTTTAQLAETLKLPVVKNATQLYDAILAAVANGKGDIYLQDMTYDLSTVPGVVLPINISNTALRIHGIRPQISDEPYNPDLTFSIRGGSIITTNGLDVFTGTGIEGMELENFSFVNCGTCINFGATDVIGLAFSTIRQVYAVSCSGTFIKITNMQQCYFEHIKSRDVVRGLHLINDHFTHSGPNSVVVDFYCYPKAAADGTVSRGAGVRLDAVREPFSQLTMIRPQVNAMKGTEGTGSCFWANGTGNGITGLAIIGGDLEGYVDKSFEATRLSASSLDFVMCRGKYTVHLSGGSQLNKIHVADYTTNRPDHGQIVSDNTRNYFSGRVSVATGSLSGMVYNETLLANVIYGGYATDGIRIKPEGYEFRGGAIQNMNNGFGSPSIDLKLYRGKFDGEIRADNGTNTVARGVLCCWNSGINRWVKPDGTNFAPTV